MTTYIPQDGALGMSTATLDERGQTNANRSPKNHQVQFPDHPDTLPPTTVVLRPIATPAPLGLASYASAAFVVSAYLAGWYGNETTVAAIWPFVLVFGGIGGLASGMWSFNARDTTGSVVHTLWGSLWLAMSLHWATTPVVVGLEDQRWGVLDNFAIWMVPVAAFTWACAIPLMYREWIVASVYATAAGGATLAVIGWFAPSKTVLHIAAYVWMVSSAIALYRVWVFLMHEATRNDDLLPMFRTHLGKNHANGRWTSPSREAGVSRV